MSGHNAENGVGEHLAAAWMRGDGTGYYFTCPVCHFYKNGKPGLCRRIGCGGTVEKVEVRVIPPGRCARDNEDGAA